MVGRPIRMGLVLTGGTIAPSDRGDFLVIDLTDNGVDSGSQLFVKAWQGPERLDLHIRTPLETLSENICPRDWVRIADAVRELVEKEGTKSVVVLHGTDTAGYTAAALSFALADVEATVVVTGSHLPVSNVNSDARTNVGDAISVSRQLPHGVYLSFAGTPSGRSEVHRGTTVRNMRNQGQSYWSPNHGPVATVDNGTVEIIDTLTPVAPRSSVQVFSQQVVFITVYPGADLELMATMLIESQKRGVIVRLFPAGTGSENSGPDSLLRFVQRCVEHDIVVITAVEQYAAESHIYPSRISTEQAGAVFAADMIPETAYVKLCWALAQEQSADAARKLFTTPIAGESTVLADSAPANLR